MKTRLLGCLLAVLVCQGIASGQDKIAVTVTGGKEDARNVPVCVPLQFDKSRAAPEHLSLKVGDSSLIGQLTAPALTTENIAAQPGKIRRDLHFVVPQLKAGETLKLVEGPPVMVKGRLVFKKSTLWNLDRPVLQYMAEPYDDSTKENRERTYKVFHHLYNSEGTRVVTNGGPTGLFPHHRGLMFGFNKVTYGAGKKADTWHCPAPVFVAHNKLLNEEMGNVVGRHRVLIDWHGDKKTVFAQEERELTVFNLPGGTLVEFATRLKTTGGKIKLDGDPQHAGFQFRAANEVAEKTAKQTYYLRPDGKGKPGETRNWDAKNKGHVDLPWDAMSFVLDGKRYTVCYLNHPSNPKESRFSERDYGRFGCYFEHEVTEEQPLIVNYRVWLQDGEMIGEQVEALSRAFATPPMVK